MATLEIVDVELCRDCVVVAHNGIEYGQEFEHEPMSKIHWNEGISLKEDEDGYTDPFFSHRDCDGCEQTLAGDRYECEITRSV